MNTITLPDQITENEIKQSIEEKEGILEELKEKEEELEEEIQEIKQEKETCEGKISYFEVEIEEKSEELVKVNSDIAILERELRIIKLTKELMELRG